ncbi:BTAD domain-containing putative transcriptional regulator [Dactylosporangium fulvum]|uniref:Tetratricopeptide repeat protein n=1 Tax=Dactylosporangium fulvum TaxID=53359 RepID=A0ABY5VTQ8_9ACTN|nr:BTAD domain-containing putative transcriptional regulator [Dactylosporangium fulvum]UWP80577.1 tetratricopeptide repeat protein [Dactylosporangium fulvum]
MEFRLLGSIEAHAGETPIDVGHARQRGVLAALLVDAGEVVRADQLVERVWGARPPQRAQSTLYSYLSRLRRALTTGSGQPLLRRRSGGYLLAIDRLAVDLHLFRHLCAQARSASDDDAASAMLGEALGLWRGTAFADLDTPYFNLQRDATDQERLAAELDRCDIRLRLGHHGELLAELLTRAEAYPLDERATGQFMLALFRSGRVADALAHYRLTRRRLSEELGSDPSMALQQLHERIIAGDPVLNAAGAPAPRARLLVEAPRQLPAPPAVFVGRAWEMAELDRVADTGDVLGIAVIGGTGGIGKTSLALHWAHRNIDRFPAGQLYVDLRGFDPAGNPVPASVALHGFLEALGVAPTEIPADLPSRTALYRSLVAGRRMLVLLDNANSTAQVEPLLPGSPDCMVLVTGRRQFAGLVTAFGARPLALDALPRSEGQELLVHHLGWHRAAREPEAAAALVAHCAGLPLATSIVAARARIQSGLPLAVLAEELGDRSARLDALDADDLNADLRAVFSSSYQALDPDLARMFGLLGDAPGPDISLSAVAELTGQSAARTRVALRRLTAAYLLQEHVAGRYRMHDLVHLYAAERCAHDQPAAVVGSARQRLASFYTGIALAADRLLSPQRTAITMDPARARPSGAPTDAAAAMAWFEAEHRCLLALHREVVEHGRHAEAWQLAWSLDTFQWRRGYLHERVAMLQAAIAATETLANRAALALNHRLLGRAYVPLGQHARALHHLRQATAGYEEAGDADGQAQTQLNLALAWEHVGDYRQALTHAAANLRIRAALGNPAREAEALNALGWYHARVQDYEEAARYCHRALALCREQGYREGEAYTSDSLGYIAYHSGRPAPALRHYLDALRLRRELGDTYEEADTLVHLGDVYRAVGRTADALSAWREALALYEEQHRARQAASVLDKLVEVRAGRVHEETA